MDDQHNFSGLGVDVGDHLLDHGADDAFLSRASVV
jgi:hypothetical protein